ncbi:MAG: hypothetical protein ACLFUW_00215 [Bacteroidales bacterium]
MPQFQLLNKQPGFAEQLGSQLGQGLGQGLSQGIQQRLANFENQKKAALIEDDLIARGMPPDLAKLASVAPTGGQTEILKKVLEERETGPLDKSLFSETFTEDETDVDPIEPVPTPRTRKEKQAHEREKEKRSFERNKNYLNRISGIANELPKEKLALSQMEGALNSGDFNSWRNAIAEMTGFDILKTSSAQTVNSASKQFLMSSLAGLTGRPNQFIERQITKGLISPLYKDEANKLIYEGYNGLADLKEKEVEIALDLEEKYTSAGREIPRNFQKLVRDKLKKEAEKFEDDYEKQIKDRLDFEKKSQLMIAPDGKKYNVPQEKVKEAHQAGYRLSR